MLCWQYCVIVTCLNEIHAQSVGGLQKSVDSKLSNLPLAGTSGEWEWNGIPRMNISCILNVLEWSTPPFSQSSRIAAALYCHRTSSAVSPTFANKDNKTSSIFTRDGLLQLDEERWDSEQSLINVQLATQNELYKAFIIYYRQAKTFIIPHHCILANSVTVFSFVFVCLV